MPLSLSHNKVTGEPIKRNIASLVGGIVIGLGCFILWLLVASEVAPAAPAPLVIALGVAFGLVVGSWIRLADM